MKYLYFLLIISFFTACKTGKQTAKTNFSIVQFGSGGGFANNVTTYSVYPDGKIWMKKSFENDSSLVTGLSRRQLKKVFAEVKSAGADTMQYQAPGNLYYFIQTGNLSGKNKIVWSDDNPPPGKIPELYQVLQKTIK